MVPKNLVHQEDQLRLHRWWWQEHFHARIAHSFAKRNTELTAFGALESSIFIDWLLEAAHEDLLRS
jgi:hypothetical protein